MLGAARLYVELKKELPAYWYRHFSCYYNGKRSLKTGLAPAIIREMKVVVHIWVKK
jgi:hypothetical protein